MTVERKIVVLTVLAAAAVLLPAGVFAVSSGSGGSSVGCTQDVWECGTWEEECGLDNVQTRSCVMALDCPNVATPPKPSETRSCTAECTSDQWSCGAWGACIARAQQRVCTKSFDCPFLETPSPATSARCSVDCGLDQWTCGAWSACVGGARTRTCAMRENCEDRGAAKPAERETCTVTAPAPAPVPKKTTTTATPKSTTAPTPTPPPSGLVCGNLATLAERVRCRLGLSEEAMEKELAAQYLPEECRAIAQEVTRSTCIARYRVLRPCWEKPIGTERLACVRDALGLRPLAEERATCVAQEGSDGKMLCLANLRMRAYPYITFRFYDLEERAEGLLKLGAPMDGVVSFVTTAEQGKGDFNAATTTNDRIAIIRRIQSAWRAFVSALPYGVVERARKEGVGSGY